MRKYLVALVVLPFLSCSGGDTVTGPSTDVAQVAPVPATTTTQPQTVEPTPDPTRQRGPVSVECGPVQCSFSNTANSNRKVLAQCTKKLQTNDWGSVEVIVPPGTNTVAVKVLDVCDATKMGVSELRCGDVTRDVQLDFTAGQGEHIGHLLTTLTYKANPEDGWVEQPPVITYTDWGECKPVAVTAEQEQCQQSRTKTTVIDEINSCTKARRVKSETKETETRPCECPCIPRWIPIDPIVTVTYEYGEWGECRLLEQVVPNTTGPPSTCPGLQYRGVVKITTTQNREMNRCTKEIRNVGDPVVTREKQPDESRPCTVPNVLISETPGPYTWDETILEGRCEVEVFPMGESTTKPYNCHQAGMQVINQTYTCSLGVRELALCRNTECPHGTCFYNVGHGGSCYGQQQCFDQPGYLSWNPQNHLCELRFPGVSNRCFELNPGQSDPECLSKH